MLDLSKLPTQPYAHQLDELRKSAMCPFWGLFWTMGTGKTFAAILHAVALLDAGKIDAGLVIAPKGVYRNWSDVELPKHLPDVMRHVAYWTPQPRVAERESIAKAMCRGNGFTWLVMNVEALSTKKGAAAAERFLRLHRSIVIVDEATCVKNPKAARTKALLGLRSLAPYRRILTGTPITKSPLDLFAPCLFLSPDALGSRSFYAFRARFAEMEPQRIERWDADKQKRVVRTVQKVTGYKNLDDLTRILSLFSSRVMKEDCVDLPEKVYERRTVEMTREQSALYAEMQEKARATLGGEVRVEAPIAIAQILRLHQIACGFVGGDVEQSIPSRREEELLAVLGETAGKAIVWATYTHNVESIARAIAKEHGPESVVTYYGATPEDERPRNVERFQHDDRVRFFVGQPRTGGYGLTLTAASTVVYYSNSYDLEVRLQSEDRAHRIGQRNPVTYVDLVTPGTVDERIIESLRAKRSLASQVMGDGWKEWI
ncbi:MAG: DEAD/DEAH box helicase [Myxococcota bacterium]